MESSQRQTEKTSDPAGVPWRAVAGSLGLHLLVLAMLVPQFAPEGRQVPPDRVLQGRLTSSPVPVEEKVQFAPQVVAAKPVSTHRTTPLIAPAAVPPAPTFEPQPSATAETGGLPAAPEVVSPATVAVAQEWRDAGPDAAGLRQYRLSLAGEAKRFRRYPEAARREGLSGTAEIRVAVMAGERLAELSRSSGHAALDAAALDMLKQAASRAQLPESLRGRQFAVLLPVVFEVEE
jgi:protein TonB